MRRLRRELDLAEKQEITDVQANALLPLPDDEQSRMTVYLTARDRFADALGQPDVANTIVIPDLSGIEFSLMLAVHMKALVDVDATLRRREPPTGQDQQDLSLYLLNRESEHWRVAHSSGSGPLRTSELAIARSVYTATLAGPLAYDAATRVLVQGAQQPCGRSHGCRKI
jgi:hypothetical protein